MTVTTEAPIPAGTPLLGSMLDLKRDALGTFLRARETHGDVVKFLAGPPGLRRTMYGLFSAEAAQQVLATESANFRKDNYFYEVLRSTFGNGLLTSQDDTYMRQRRLIQPLFTPRGIRAYDTAITGEAAATAEGWRGQDVVDVAEEMERFTLRAVARILFGADIDTAVPAVRRFFPEISETSLRRAYGAGIVKPTWPTPRNRRFDSACEELYAVCDTLIAERRAADEPGGDLLGLLIKARTEDGETLSPDEIRDQVLVFLLAGHETTSTSLTFALHLLGRNPDAQKRMHEEIDAVLTEGRPPQAGDLDRMPYTERVIKEAMRLYPAAAATGRQAVADTEVDGVHIPAGSDVTVSAYVTHRDPAYWPDPMRFDPDRFLPEAEQSRHRYAWMPFGGGPRACIGAQFAMLESVLGLAVLLQAYEVEAVDDREIATAFGITMRPAEPVRLRLTPRS
ncbi:cytochrome P450 [Streptomyces endophyticus]|uniref:Cytochrome P450 n=1 Tax=Streptomyces endophyticus TaxID=714166 RepID=A0ABU6F1J1_9ACTN|nr:cytochrome P450 [Streptomyces endophyticus]MEB8337880.1 cytochrome P450 [Streptomyces endophyticus]